MSSKKRELYDLVHSLTKDELRTFSRSLKHESGTAYGQIFEVILAQENFNDKLLNANLQKILSGNKLAQSKRYLKRKLIDYLGKIFDSYDKNKAAHDLFSKGLGLVKRGHLDLGVAMFDKGLKFAKSNELLIPQLHGTFHKWDALTTREPIPDHVETAEIQFQESINILAKLKWHITVHHIFWQAENGLYGIGDCDFEKLWSALNEILSSPDFKQAAKKALKLHLDALSCASAIQYGLCNYDSSLSYSNKILNLFEKEMDLHRIGTRRRVIYLVNHLMILRKVPQRKIAEKTLLRAEAHLNALSGISYRKSLGLITHFYTHYLGYKNAQMETNLEVAEHSYFLVRKNIKHVGEKNLFRFVTQAAIHFILADLPTRAHDVTDIVLNKNIKEKSQQYWIIRIIDSIVHFLVDNNKYFLSSTPSLIRNLRKYTPECQLEITYLKYLQRICMGDTINNPIKAQLQKHIGDLSIDKSNLHLFILNELKKEDGI